MISLFFVNVLNPDLSSASDLPQGFSTLQLSMQNKTWQNKNTEFISVFLTPTVETCIGTVFSIKTQKNWMLAGNNVYTRILLKDHGKC